LLLNFGTRSLEYRRFAFSKYFNLRNLRILRSKINLSRNPKNKTHKKLTSDLGLTYKARVTKVTVFETNKGIGNRCGDALEERKSRRLLIL
jgi:hypothetical protein